jgi:hypothetical protein
MHLEDQFHKIKDMTPDDFSNFQNKFELDSNRAVVSKHDNNEVLHPKRYAAFLNKALAQDSRSDLEHLAKTYHFTDMETEEGKAHFEVLARWVEKHKTPTDA